jgi:hypothetical protein
MPPGPQPSPNIATPTSLPTGSFKLNSMCDSCENRNNSIVCNTCSYQFSK